MNNTTPKKFLPGTHPDWPPPVSTSGPLAWTRKNLFSSPLNTVLT
ncbi:MAG TPA: amino acid ABC transporter permease, partial [Deltaproteobacteria bacterium]|nr:amino acid ABC transporter permease [Deltaproteobacteria bacterium]